MMLKKSKPKRGTHDDPPHPFRWAVITGVVYAVAYGIVAQLLVRVFERSEGIMSVLQVMTLGFVFVLPLVMGALTVLFSPVPERKGARWAQAITSPWASILISMVIAMIVGMEGTICVILATPAAMFMGSVGGVVTGFFKYRYHDRQRNTDEGSNNTHIMMSAILLIALPFLSGFAEHYVPPKTMLSEKWTYIDINGSRQDIWNQIKRVAPITEKQSGLFYRLGFPKPIEATLSYEGIGGVRRASFEGNLVFFETVTEWQLGRKLAFKIDVDPDSTPTTTLDEHITVGGQYFDVFFGEYIIEDIGEEDSLRLHLGSKFKIDTHFNRYATWWAKLLMGEIQNNILRVIKSRVE